MVWMDGWMDLGEFSFVDFLLLGWWEECCVSSGWMMDDGWGVETVDIELPEA